MFAPIKVRNETDLTKKEAEELGIRVFSDTVSVRVDMTTLAVVHHVLSGGSYTDADRSMVWRH